MLDGAMRREGIEAPVGAEGLRFGDGGEVRNKRERAPLARAVQTLREDGARR